MAGVSLTYEVWYSVDPTLGFDRLRTGWMLADVSRRGGAKLQRPSVSATRSHTIELTMDAVWLARLDEKTFQC
jgi:hypothetical protein